MRTVYSEQHRRRDPRTELYEGRLVEPFERPSRAEIVLARVRSTGLGEVIGPDDVGLDPILAVHDTGFVDFLRTAWNEWSADARPGEAIPEAWPARRMNGPVPDSIDGKLGYYAFAGETSITDGTWEAAYAAAQVAVTATDLVLGGDDASFALCRPPGHHAARDLYGGYCFLNNAAIAAQRLRSRHDLVAIVDVDFHHGNGTQDIFYERDDVFFASLHGDPRVAFPYFAGHQDEIGSGPGEGANMNIPYPEGTGFAEWRAGLAEALAGAIDFGADAVVVSLGVDTFAGDPISFFRLESDDYLTVGADLAGLALPTVFVMEGGYDVDEIGVNTVKVLEAFERAR